MFQPDGFPETFGEMTQEQKHGIDWSRDGGTALSHRARAFLRLAAGSLTRP
jgi:XTP/dITP diphosphohydrolase